MGDVARHGGNNIVPDGLFSKFDELCPELCRLGLRNLNGHDHPLGDQGIDHTFPAGHGFILGNGQFLVRYHAHFGKCIYQVVVSCCHRKLIKTAKGPKRVESLRALKPKLKSVNSSCTPRQAGKGANGYPNNRLHPSL